MCPAAIVLLLFITGYLICTSIAENYVASPLGYLASRQRYRLSVPRSEDTRTEAEKQHDLQMKLSQVGTHTSPIILPHWTSPGNVGPIQVDNRTGNYAYLTMAHRGDSTDQGMRRMSQGEIDSQEVLDFAHLSHQKQIADHYNY